MSARFVKARKGESSVQKRWRNGSDFRAACRQCRWRGPWRGIRYSVAEFEASRHSVEQHAEAA